MTDKEEEQYNELFILLITQLEQLSFSSAVLSILYSSPVIFFK